MLSKVAHLREFHPFINNLDLSEIVAQLNAAVLLICWSVSDYRPWMPPTLSGIP